MAVIPHKARKWLVKVGQRPTRYPINPNLTRTHTQLQRDMGRQTRAQRGERPHMRERRQTTVDGRCPIYPNLTELQDKKHSFEYSETYHVREASDDSRWL